MTTTDVATMAKNAHMALIEAILGIDRGDDMLATSARLYEVAELAKEAAMVAYELYEQVEDES